MEASAYTAATTALDLLLVHRGQLLNGTTKERKERIELILLPCGLMADGALPVSVFLAVALILVPGLTMVMRPIGVIGSAGLGLRLITSAVWHLSKPEQQAVQQLRASDQRCCPHPLPWWPGCR